MAQPGNDWDYTECQDRAMPTLHSHQNAAAAGSRTCPPVISGASVPLFETVNAFAAGQNADFGGALPAFKLDPGIMAAQLGADGAPVCARRASGYTLSTHGAGATLLSVCFAEMSAYPKP